MEKKELVVVYIITKLELGGAQKVCLSLFNGLNQDQKAFLISGKQGTLVDAVKSNPNIMLLPDFIREVSWFGFFKEFKNFGVLIKQLRALKRTYPNIMVHTHSTKAGIIGRWAAFFAGIPHRIHTVHGFGFHPYQSRIGWWINYWFELITSFITTQYICVSSADANTGKQWLPKFSTKHTIIRAAVDDQFFLTAKKTDFNFNASTETFIFGTIACFKKQKNLFDLLYAFKLVYDQNQQVRLEIIGDGHLRPAIEAWISEHHLSDVIILHGWQSDVVQYMQKWNAFVLSSLWEGLPCAIVEARLINLPVISYNTGGIADVIIDKKNGLLIKPKDWQELAIAMIEIQKNKELLQQMQSFDDNLDDFKNNFMIDQHTALYRRIVIQSSQV